MTMTESCIVGYLLLAKSSAMGYQICERGAEGGGELMESETFQGNVRNKCEWPLAWNKVQGSL